MSRKKRNRHSGQYEFGFDAPAPATAPASLAGLDRQICEAVSTILHDDDRRRELIAAEMSVVLGDDVSVHALNAMSSPARLEHKVHADRLFALIAVTGRHDVLDMLLRKIGGALLVGEEVHTARLGHIDREIARLNAERKALANKAPLIREAKGS